MTWADPGALAAWSTTLATVVLVGVTWYYVRLTRDLVRQNQETVERERAREEARRRTTAAELRARAGELVVPKQIPVGNAEGQLRAGLEHLRGLAVDLDDPETSREAHAALDAFREAERAETRGGTVRPMSAVREHLRRAADLADAIARGGWNDLSR